MKWSDTRCLVASIPVRKPDLWMSLAQPLVELNAMVHAPQLDLCLVRGPVSFAGTNYRKRTAGQQHRRSILLQLLLVF